MPSEVNMRYFDLHCDTIGECSNNNLSLKNNDLHIDLERAKAHDKYAQVFAIWIPDQFRGKVAVKYFDKTANYFYKELTNEYIQTTATLNVGCSGGGLFDLSGKLIGINTWKLIDSSDNIEGMNFSISVDKVKSLFSSYLQ